MVLVPTALTACTSFGFSAPGNDADCPKRRSVSAERSVRSSRPLIGEAPENATCGRPAVVDVSPIYEIGVTSIRNTARLKRDTNRVDIPASCAFTPPTLKRRSVGRRAINWLLTGDRTATRRTVSSVSAITAAMMLSRARALSVSARIVRACAPSNGACETANAASATLTARALLLLRQFIISCSSIVCRRRDAYCFVGRGDAAGLPGALADGLADEDGAGLSDAAGVALGSGDGDALRDDAEALALADAFTDVREAVRGVAAGRAGIGSLAGAASGSVAGPLFGSVAGSGAFG